MKPKVSCKPKPRPPVKTAPKRAVKPQTQKRVGYGPG